MRSDIEGQMGFTLPKYVIPDTERKGRLRSVTPTQGYSYAPEEIDARKCHLHDLSSGKYQSDLSRMGFDTIDLSQQVKLMATLELLSEKAEIDEDDIDHIRKAFQHCVFKLSNGKRLRVLQVAGEGVLMRHSGPNGMEIDHDENLPDHSTQGAAVMVHGDQDVYGLPLKRMMKGMAPYVFRHRSPDGKNTLSPLMLVNFWIPFHQINMPLCLMDRSTLNSREHQLCFQFNTGELLGRDSERTRNDIWAFLFDERQRWYFHSEMNLGQAYVFDTLGMPHGAAILAGEKRAHQLYTQIVRCLHEIARGNKIAFRIASANQILHPVGSTTAPLASAIDSMEEVVQEAIAKDEHFFSANTGEEVKDWIRRAVQAKNRVIRKSLEFRTVCIMY